MEVTVIPCLKDNYCYLVKSGQRAVLIDGSEAGAITKAIQKEQLSLEVLLLTHNDWDHVDGLEEIKSSFPDLPIYGFQGKTNKVEEADNHIQEEGPLEINGFRIEVLFTPGHSKNDISFHFPDIKSVFVGDTLFVSGCGRVFTQDYTAMSESLDKLSKLPEDTKVYCGHEYTETNLKFALYIEPDNKHVQAKAKNLTIPSVPSTIYEELQGNPFFRLEAKELSSRVEELKPELDYSNLSKPEKLKVVRKLKESF